MEPLPLADFFEAVELHFSKRQALISAVATLDDRAHQFRSIQKRLLVRFKDRNSAPLDHLDTLLAGTFDKIHEASEVVDAARADLTSAANALALITGLTVLLMRLRYQLNPEDFNVVQAAIPTTIDDRDDGSEGWEERTDAAVMHLLRTTLAKNSKDSSGAAVASTELGIPKNLKKLKKHLTIFCDRLAKGARPAGKPGKQKDGK